MNSQNFQFSAKVLGSQDLLLTLRGITGSKMSYGKYIATCWQGSEIGGHFKKHLIFIDEGESFTVSFPNLNMDEFPYNISFSVGAEVDQQDQDYYVASIEIPQGSNSGKIFHSKDPVNIALEYQQGRTIRVNCSYPSANSAQVHPQYVVLNKGDMSNSFHQIPVDRLTTWCLVEDISNIIFNVSKDLRRGDTYTLAYVMGGSMDKPDLNRVVAWTEFVAS